MPALKTEDLMMIFPEIGKAISKRFNLYTKHHELALVPVMHAFIPKIIKDIEENREKYGITDIVSDSQQPKKIILAIDGRIIILHKTAFELSNEDFDTFWYFDDKLFINGNEEVGLQLLEKIKEFSKKLDQSALLKEARQGIIDNDIPRPPRVWKEFYGV